MKILITGSSGFVGQHLTQLLNKKHQVTGFDLKNGEDIFNKNLLKQKMEGVEAVIHLAAYISATESWEKPEEYLNNNALGTLRVVEAAIKANVKKLIFFSSAAVKAEPLTPYAVSKIAAEEILKLYLEKINTVIVRPENIYGSGQKESYGYVIHNFINAARTGQPIKIYGSGKQTRDFVNISDVVLTVEKIIELQLKSGLIINVGTGRETSILELAEKVNNLFKNKSEIIFDFARNEPQKSVADTKNLKVLGINSNSFASLENGIKNLLMGK
jgi:UDP-glucose 4-epimerase